MADKKEKEGSKKTRRAYSRYVQDPVFVGLALLALLLAMTTFYFASGANCPTGGVVAVDDYVDDTGDGEIVIETGDNEGDGEKLQIRVFSEFLCPFSSAAAGKNTALIEKFQSQDPNWRAPIEGIREEYGDKVNLVFKHFLVHGEAAQKASEASECARDQGKFWEYHDVLFENQGNLDVDNLKQYAANIGLDTEKFDSCLDSGEKADLVQADSAEGRELGVRGTPTFIIGESTVVGAQPFSEVQKVIELELNPELKAAEEQRKAEEEKARLEAINTALAIEKGDNKPQIDFFVMAYCPYGNMAEEAIEPVYQNLKDKAIFNPHYVIYANYGGGGSDYCIEDGKYCSMHGIQELNQGIRELCVNKYEGIGKYFEFVLAMNEKCSYTNADTCWEQVAADLGLDTGKIATCQQEEGAELAKKEYEACQALRVSGSPTVFLDGEKYSGQRTPKAFQDSLCNAFEDAPSECGNSQSGESQGPPGSC